MSIVLASDPTDDTHTSGGRFSFRGRGLGLGLGRDFSALRAKSDAKDLQVRALLNDFNAQQEMTAAKVKQVEEKVIGLGAGGGGDGRDLGGAVEVAQTVGGLGDAQYQAFLAADPAFLAAIETALADRFAGRITDLEEENKGLKGDVKTLKDENEDLNKCLATQGERIVAAEVRIGRVESRQQGGH